MSSQSDAYNEAAQDLEDIARGLLKDYKASFDACMRAAELLRSTSAPCNMDVIVSHERHEHLLKCESLLSETPRGDTARKLLKEARAMLTSGSVHGAVTRRELAERIDCFFRDSFANELVSSWVAYGHAVRSNGGSAKVPEGCQRTVHGYCPRGCMGQCAAEVKAMRKT